MFQSITLTISNSHTIKNKDHQPAQFIVPSSASSLKMMIPVSPQLCVQHAHKETQRRPSPGADRTVADQGGGAGDDDHLDQSDQRSKNIFHYS